MQPESLARQKIDRFLQQAGWVLQDRSEFDRNAAVGVAVREFPLESGACDYLLFVGGRACGVIEAKKEGVTLTGVAEQTARYVRSFPSGLAHWDRYASLEFESTGTETLFLDRGDPKPRSRRVFAFPRPETVLGWMQDRSGTLRTHLTRMPPLITTGLRQCQIDAIQGLERSLAEARPRALIQMATGAGKTFTACTASWRLIKHARARRILFLVDRSNLGNQTLREFRDFHPHGAANRFTDTYIVQQLTGRRIDPDAKVVISTIQRLYSMLRGRELDAAEEEASAFEREDGASDADGELPPIAYNPDIPVETFDFIITDECHRSIYGLWRQVLEYFDAFLIGLTATPSAHTLGFFNQNLVAEYPYEQSVADGVNVGYEIFRIKTRVSEKGGTIEADGGFTVPVRDKRTRRLRYRELDEDLEYKAADLDRSVLNPNQIRTVLRAYKDAVFTRLFPERSGQWLPKTLIFAKDDNHAEEIVMAVREIFGEGDDFARKITYRSGSEDPRSLIKAFRNEPFPRIAVTVDMIATGTDIKPVEVVMFLRDVKSEGYYEQMKGRGVRTIASADLRQVTPDAHTKTRFILVDAVGVTESKKNVSRPLERKRTVSLEKLLEQVAMGSQDEDVLSSLAGRLAALNQQLDRDGQDALAETMDGETLASLAGSLIRAIDPDEQERAILAEAGVDAAPVQCEAIVARMLEAACAPFSKPRLRQAILDARRRSELYIDETTPDEVTHAEYDIRQAEQTVQSFKDFIATNRDELTALQILYNQPYGRQRITYAAIRELVQALRSQPPYLTTADVWQAYKRLDAAHVRGAPLDEQLTEIVSLVRFALRQTEMLESFTAVVEQRFNLWLGREKKAGRDYSDEQQQWLRAIAGFIAANAEIAPRDFMEAPSLKDRGGIVRARQVLGEGLNEMLGELVEALVA